MSWFSNFFRFTTTQQTLGWVTEVHDPQAVFDGVLSSNLRVNTVLGSPALLSIFALQCDLFSLGDIVLTDADGNTIEEADLLNTLDRPNPFMEKSDFLWCVMFAIMLGNCYIYHYRSATGQDKLYILDERNMEFSDKLRQYNERIILSARTLKKMEGEMVRYKVSDTESINIEWGDIIHIPDIQYLGALKGSSRLEAAIKIVANSESALEAQNINLRYSGKFMVAGKTDEGNVMKLTLSPQEKDDIEKKIEGTKNVHAVRSLIDIKRFVEDIGSLKLTEAYMDAYFQIGKLYSIPKDVLEAYQSSTFENQEKARGAHVSYTLQPKGEQLMAGLIRSFDMENAKGTLSWNHLPFMTVFKKQEAELKEKQVDTMQKLLSMGIDIDQINAFLGTNFEQNENNEHQDDTGGRA